MLRGHIKIAEVTRSSVAKTIQNTSINDFEDGWEYYAAIENKCHCIITEDINDFYFSEIEILNSHNFFMKYMAKVI